MDSVADLRGSSPSIKLAKEDKERRDAGRVQQEKAAERRKAEKVLLDAKRCKKERAVNSALKEEKCPSNGPRSRAVFQSFCWCETWRKPGNSRIGHLTFRHQITVEKRCVCLTVWSE
ncbi:hypothetical protein BV898_04403 [Hypsibius exemplaris]|uniref:Uncharacterized protein n=1 Tax=Hypsibius exemplaris TaxID=2072580 RepID=A0A1W0X3E4_HYPEX|nr:hypothetical protein BV898_04403 [Hypsibius exemplaris]